MQEAFRQITFHAENLSKNFDRKIIFKDINLSLSGGDSLAITGKNGSGKSTLIKILSALLNQTSGTINLNINNNIIERSRIYNFVGLVSPYINLYDEFTGYENLHFVSLIRGTFEKDKIDEVVKRVGLFERRNDKIRIYSSGMKQRLKLAFSILHNPPILLLDEPTDNLDSEGIRIVDEIVNEQKKDKILIVATNNEYEKSYCEKEIRINQ